MSFLAKIGFGSGLFCIISSLYRIGFVSFASYLTCWCLVVHVLALFKLCFTLDRDETTRRLLIVGWTVGWIVCLIFWLVIFPSYSSAQLPPVWHYLLTHGGIHLILSREILKNPFHVSLKDILWPLIFVFCYLFLMLLPLKYYGITVYPKVFEEFFITILVILGSITVMGLSFTSIYFLLRKNKNI